LAHCLAACTVLYSNMVMVMGRLLPARGDRPRHLLRFREVHVAHEVVALLRGGILHTVHAHVDHDRTGLDHVPGHELGLPIAHDQDVGEPRDRPHVPRAGVDIP